MSELSFKTRFLNSIREIFKFPFFEHFFYRKTKGRSDQNIWIKFLPNHYQYKPNSLRTVTRNSIRYRLDLSDIVDWYTFFDIKEKAHAEFISRLKKSSIVIDVGANIGSITLRLAQKCQKGFVYSFEPDEVNYKKLIDNISLNDFDNIKPLKYGVGERESTKYLETLDTFNKGKNRVLDISESEDSAKIKLISLDDFAQKENLIKIDAIKIDVEGYEYRVLLGARELIRRDRPLLLLELDDVHLKKYNATIKDIFKFLKAHHYTIWDPVTLKEFQLNDEANNIHRDVICY